MKLLLNLILVLCCVSAQAASVRIWFVDRFTGTNDTNYVLVTAVDTNVLASGGVSGRGVTKRYNPPAHGYLTNVLTVGHYSLENPTLKTSVLIRVPDTSGFYDYTNLLISGFSTFVTIEPTFSGITNALGYLPATNGSGGSAVTATNLAQALTNAGVVTINVSTQAVVQVLQNNAVLTNNNASVATLPTAVIGGITFSGGTISLSSPGDSDEFDSSGAFTLANGNITSDASGNLTAASFSGNGASLTALNGSSIASGTVADARIDSALARDAEVPGIMDTNGLVVFNVEKYGALPNTESTVAIQAAIDAATPGSVVYFPRRNYIVGTLKAGHTLTLMGNGSDYSYEPTLYNTNGAHLLVITNSSLSGFNMEVKGMNLITTGTTNAVIWAGAPASLNGIGLINVNNCQISGGAYGVYTTNVFTSTFHRLKFSTNGVALFFVGGYPGSVKVSECSGGNMVGTFLYHDATANLVCEQLDSTALTNHIRVTGRAQFYDIHNSNFEGSALSDPDQQNRAYIYAHGTASSSSRILLRGARFGTKNGGTPFTDTYCLSVSNIITKIEEGNEFNQAGATGQYIEEFGEIPVPIFGAGLPITTTIIITNRTRRIGRNMTPYLYDIADAGRTSFSGQAVRGQMFFDSRTNTTSSDALYLHTFFNGAYSWRNLLSYDTDRLLNSRLSVGSNAWTGFSLASSSYGLDVAGNYMYFGSDANIAGSFRTDNTFKQFRALMPQYDTDAVPSLFFQFVNGNTDNGAYYGGGSASFHAATFHRFYAAASIGTTSGTLTFEIQNEGIYANTNVFAQSITATNGAIFPQLSAIPTNVITSANGSTNIWIGNINGILLTLKTNRDAGGWSRLRSTDETWVAYP